MRRGTQVHRFLVLVWRGGHRLGVGAETIPVSFTAVHAPNRINMAEITERDRYAKRWTDEARGPHSTGGAVNVELSTRGRGWLFR